MENYELLNISAGLSNGKLVAKCNGTLASAAQPLLDKLIKTLNSLKVISTKNEKNIYNLYNPPHPSKVGMRSLERNIKELILKTVFPGTANLAVTSLCQCNCAHCSADLFRNRNKEDISFIEMKKVIDNCLELGVSLIIFVGGEPLLNKEIFNLIKYVDKDKAIVSLFTNGLLLSKENTKKLADTGLFCLYLSLDSVHPETHNKLRGVKDLFQKGIEGAAYARECGILTGISTYATTQTLKSGDVENLIQLAQKEGFNEVTIFDCIPSGKYLKETQLMLSPEDKKNLTALANKYHNSTHPMGVIAQCIVNSPEGAGCFGAFSQFYMTAYGDVNPCDFNPISFGNVRKKHLAAIWKKMISHPDFSYRYKTCRMQTPEYRAKYIDCLPDDVCLPVPIEAYEGQKPLLRAELPRQS
ncbi:MAG: radical SAM protein [Planctomycetota bacterium]